MVQTIRKKRASIEPVQSSHKIDRHKIGKAPPDSFVPKATSPGVISIKMPKVVPSRPQVKERMGVGGSKARKRHKGRVDPKAANPKDPGQTPFASTKQHWPTSDKNAHKGYVVGKAWPKKSKTRAGGNADGLQEGIGADGPY